MTFYHIPMIIQAKVSLDRVNEFLRKVHNSTHAYHIWCSGASP